METVITIKKRCLRMSNSTSQHEKNESSDFDNFQTTSRDLQRTVFNSLAQYSWRAMQPNLKEANKVKLNIRCYISRITTSLCAFKRNRTKNTCVFASADVTALNFFVFWKVRQVNLRID